EAHKRRLSGARYQPSARPAKDSGCFRVFRDVLAIAIANKCKRALRGSSALACTAFIALGEWPSTSWARHAHQDAHSPCFRLLSRPYSNLLGATSEAHALPEVLTVALPRPASHRRLMRRELER